MRIKNPHCHLFAFTGQIDAQSPAIMAIDPTLDQRLTFQAIKESRDRSTCYACLFGEFIGSQSIAGGF